ncbi:MAG: hypothetical protein ACJAUH_000764 [Saprospiraceae bacterium]
MADAPLNRGKLAVMDEEAFEMSFNFQLQGGTNFSIHLERKDKIDYIQIYDDCNRSLAEKFAIYVRGKEFFSK